MAEDSGRGCLWRAYAFLPRSVVKMSIGAYGFGKYHFVKYSKPVPRGSKFYYVSRVMLEATLSAS